ncbi:GTP-binding protein [Planosporangium thailandense]|uniref:GTP-binding protein n=1 Tax=Planosporangium thailandense TaxID=765197 RepID=A0ABX0XUW8_9ACTN|nr:dynamin family protein [Planosporangium thailandense]NJC69008.1 GTP-binding protein [Planosporangium thailandense]
MAPTWLDLLDETTRVCAAHGRGDLIQWLQQKRAQLVDPRLRVLVLGEPKQGKSQLINALVNAPVCAVGDGPTTTVPTVVHHAESPTAVLVRTPPATPAGAAGELAAPPERIPLSLEQIGAGIDARLPHRAGPAASAHLEVGVPRGLLASGLVLIDTPGTDEQDQARNASIFAALARADTVLLVSDATQELSVSELNLLLHVAQSHPNVAVVLTKIDMSPDWRAVAEHNRRHIAGTGVQAAVIPVSSALRLQAALTNDEAINAESGFPELIARLVHDQAAKGDALARASVGQVARTVVEQLAAPLRAELAVTESPETAGPISRLQEAQRAVDDLRRRTVTWQNMLGDEMADLISDIEYDLRDRTRQILRKVDEAFDQADPLTGWDAFAAWLEENLSEAAEANFAWMVQRLDWITHRIAGTFARYGTDVVPGWSITVPDDLADRVPAIEKPTVEKFSPTQKVFTALRSSYGGMLMFGMATTLAGLPLINPVSLGAGAIFGGKGILDESKSLLKRRQAAAKTAAQRHVDDFFLRLSKDARDTARQVHRMLRDHFAALTEELQEAIVASFRTAKQEADAVTAVREQRQRAVEQAMRRLAVLLEEAQEITAGRGGALRARLEHIA